MAWILAQVDLDVLFCLFILFSLNCLAVLYFFCIYIVWFMCFLLFIVCLQNSLGSTQIIADVLHLNKNM